MANGGSYGSGPFGQVNVRTPGMGGLVDTILQKKSEYDLKETLADLDSNDPESLRATADKMLKSGKPDQMAMGLKLQELYAGRRRLAGQEAFGRGAQGLFGSAAPSGAIERYDLPPPGEKPGADAPPRPISEDEARELYEPKPVDPRSVPNMVPRPGGQSAVPGSQSTAPSIAPQPTRPGFIGAQAPQNTGITASLGPASSFAEPPPSPPQQFAQAPRPGVATDAPPPGFAPRPHVGAPQAPGATPVSPLSAPSVYAPALPAGRPIPQTEGPPPPSPEETRLETISRNMRLFSANPMAEPHQAAAIRAQADAVDKQRQELATRRHEAWKNRRESIETEAKEGRRESREIRTEGAKKDIDQAVKLTEKSREDSDKSAVALNSGERLLRLLDSGKIRTGPSGEIQVGAGALASDAMRFLNDITESVSGAAGYKMTPFQGTLKATDNFVAANQQFHAFSSRGIYDLAGGYGKAFSDADRVSLSQTYSGMPSNIETNRAIIKFYNTANLLKMEETKAIESYRESRKARGLQPDSDDIQKIKRIGHERARTILNGMAEADAVRFGTAGPTEHKAEIEKSRSKTQAPAQVPAQAGPPRVRSIDEARKLPKGTRFIDPNGVERVVP